jgi:hypothetical protein
MSVYFKQVLVADTQHLVVAWSHTVVPALREESIIGLRTQSRLSLALLVAGMAAL